MQYRESRVVRYCYVFAAGDGHCQWVGGRGSALSAPTTHAHKLPANADDSTETLHKYSQVRCNQACHLSVQTKDSTCLLVRNPSATRPYSTRNPNITLTHPPPLLKARTAEEWVGVARTAEINVIAVENHVCKQNIQMKMKKKKEENTIFFKISSISRNIFLNSEKWLKFYRIYLFTLYCSGEHFII